MVMCLSPWRTGESDNDRIRTLMIRMGLPKGSQDIFPVHDPCHDPNLVLDPRRTWQELGQSKVVDRVPIGTPTSNWTRSFD